MSSYYESEDLKKFGDIGQHGKNLADDFFKYYGNVTGADGALTKREKALIALAVSHALKCPYCIDVHVKKAKAAGASDAELTEATMVAAALRAGGAVTHGTHAIG